MISICRLCANCKEEHEISAQITELESKLALFSGWYPTADELKLPTKVCDNCVFDLDKCITFVEKVKDAELKLIKLSMEQNEASAIEHTTYDTVMADEEIKVDPDICSVEINEFDSSFFGGMDDDDGDAEANFEDPIIDSGPECSNSTKVEKNVPEADPILDHLNDEERIVDGTVSASGVLKLEKLYPIMKTITWTNCFYKCEKCNQTIQGILLMTDVD